MSTKALFNKKRRKKKTSSQPGRQHPNYISLLISNWTFPKLGLQTSRSLSLSLSSISQPKRNAGTTLHPVRWFQYEQQKQYSTPLNPTIQKKETSKSGLFQPNAKKISKDDLKDLQKNHISTALVGPFLRPGWIVQVAALSGARAVHPAAAQNGRDITPQGAANLCLGWVSWNQMGVKSMGKSMGKSVKHKG